MYHAIKSGIAATAVVASLLASTSPDPKDDDSCIDIKKVAAQFMSSASYDLRDEEYNAFRLNLQASYGVKLEDTDRLMAYKVDEDNLMLITFNHDCAVSFAMSPKNLFLKVLNGNRT